MRRSSLLTASKVPRRETVSHQVDRTPGRNGPINKFRLFYQIYIVYIHICLTFEVNLKAIADRVIFRN